MSYCNILYGAKHNRFPRPPLDWANCGTEAKYRNHLRHGEPACDRCKRANARAQADRRAKRSQAARP